MCLVDFKSWYTKRALIKQWRREYNQLRLHSDLGYRPPVPEAILTVTMT